MGYQSRFPEFQDSKSVSASEGEQTPTPTPAERWSAAERAAARRTKRDRQDKSARVFKVQREVRAVKNVLERLRISFRDVASRPESSPGEKTFTKASLDSVYNWGTREHPMQASAMSDTPEA